MGVGRNSIWHTGFSPIMMGTVVEGLLRPCLGSGLCRAGTDIRRYGHYMFRKIKIMRDLSCWHAVVDEVSGMLD
jgi:hypothetical protein